MTIVPRLVESFTYLPLWMALTKNIDFGRPDADEVKLQAAIMNSTPIETPWPIPH